MLLASRLWLWLAGVVGRDHRPDPDDEIHWDTEDQSDNCRAEGNDDYIEDHVKIRGNGMGTLPI